MSRFLAAAFASLTPYTPGEQPKGERLIKLNTNESPYPPPPSVTEAAFSAAHSLNLYSDPTCLELRRAAAHILSVDPDNIIAGNGSDEILFFAFTAYAGSGGRIAYPDVTYGFYPVFAGITGACGIPLPLRDDLTVDCGDYLDIARFGANTAIVLANPNAPTGIALSRDEIETIVKSNPGSVVMIDEAYVDFGGESSVPLTAKYNNLLVIRTFSKSRSLAGARLGFGIGCKELISDLEKIRCSINPYNVNKMTQDVGIAACAEEKYYRECCERIIKTRESLMKTLKSLGFYVIPSAANFLFVEHERLSGELIAAELRRRGVLVRRFDAPRTRNFLRISIGAEEETDELINILNEITAVR